MKILKNPIENEKTLKSGILLKSHQKKVDNRRRRSDKVIKHQKFDKKNKSTLKCGVLLKSFCQAKVENASF